MITVRRDGAARPASRRLAASILQPTCRSKAVARGVQEPAGRRPASAPAPEGTMKYEVDDRVLEPEKETMPEIGWIEDPDDDTESSDDSPSNRPPAPRPEILLPGRHYRLD